MAKTLTRNEIEEKIEMLVQKLRKRSLYNITYKVSSTGFPELKDIEQVITHLYDPQDFKKRNREKDYVFYRHLFCKLCHDLKYTHVQISEYLKQNRSTITHAINKINNYLDIKDPETTKVYKETTNYIIDIYGEAIYRRNIIKGIDS